MTDLKAKGNELIALRKELTAEYNRDIDTLSRYHSLSEFISLNSEYSRLYQEVADLAISLYKVA